MTLYHPILEPLEKHLLRPFVFSKMSGGWYLLTANHFEFWTALKERMGLPLFERIAQRWCGITEKCICPEFDEIEMLVSWSYYLFLKQYLAPRSVKLVLNLRPPVEIEFSKRIAEWRAEGHDILPPPSDSVGKKTK